jgi:hypothetical protein
MATCRIAKVDLPDGDGKVGMVDLTASPFKPLLSEEDMAGDFALPFLTTRLTLSPRLSLSLRLHLGSISRALSILPCVCRARGCPFFLVLHLLSLQSMRLTIISCVLPFTLVFAEYEAEMASTQKAPPTDAKLK